MATNTLGVRDLAKLLRECGAADEAVVVTEHVLDMTFTELGYDSLALLQTTGRVERDLGILLGDEALCDAGTPRILLGMINEALLGRPASDAVPGTPFGGGPVPGPFGGPFGGSLEAA